MADEGYKRKLTAIFSADVAGYSRLMCDDEEATVRTINSYREVMIVLIAEHRGRVVDAKGDNVLAEFNSVVDAVQCAVAVQNELKERNSEVQKQRRMEFRIGINLGDVIEEEETIYGDGVNIAARLEGLAEGGGICISGSAFEQVKGKLKVGYEYLGEQSVKNIAEKVRVYRVIMEPETAGSVIYRHRRDDPGHKRSSTIVALLIVILGVASIGTWHFYFRPLKIEPASREKMAFPLPDKPSVAVMPFLNMTADSKQDFFADGLSEGIITALAKVPQLFVIGRDSTFSYKGKAVKAKQVSEELGVQYVLEGSVQKAGDKARITAQLIDALKGHHLWAERYDRELKDVFAVQDEVTKKILTALDMKLTRGEWGRIVSKGTENLDAYLKSQEAASCADQSTKESLERGRRLSEEALALDPKFPHPYHVLGILHMIESLSGFSKNPRDSLELANKMQLKAIELDESFAVARAVMGFNLLMLRKYDEAIEEAERAYRQAPGSSSVLYWYGTVLANSGWPQEAVPILREVLRLEPMPMNSRLRSLSAALRDSGQYNEAIECIKKAIQREPNSMPSQLILTSIYAYAGREEEARAAAKEILRINPKFSIEQYMKASPQRDANARERFAQALKIAGLPEHPPLPLPDKPSIAVLPFVNMSEDKSQEYFSDGLTEEIITALSKTPKLFVIARNSSFVYKGKPVNVQQVSQELGVKYVLEGSVRRSGDHLRITTQLIDAVTGNHLWADRYDRKMKDVFAIQDEITMKIITALQVKLTEGEQARLHEKWTSNIGIYLKLLEVRDLLMFRTSVKTVIEAKRLTQEIIAQDPTCAVAYRMLASCIYQEMVLGVSKTPKESLAEAIKTIQKAIRMGDESSSAHGGLSFLYALAMKYNESIAEGERAVAVEPNYADGHNFLAYSLRYAGRYEEAISSSKTAILLNPMAPEWYFRNLGLAYSMNGQHQEGISACEKAVRLAPNLIYSQIALTMAYGYAGREAEAQQQALEVLRLDPRFSIDTFAKRALTYKKQEDRDRAVDVLRKAGLK